MTKSIIHLVISCFVLYSCGSPTAETTEPSADISDTEVSVSEKQLAQLNLQLGKPQERSIGSSVQASGMLDVPPQNIVTISAPFGGFVKKTELLQGMKVTKGQILAVMEHPDYVQLQQDFLESKSRLDFLEQEYQRQEALAKENINAAKVLQQTKADLLSIKAKTNGFRAKLKMIGIDEDGLLQGNIKSTIDIISPISGFVTQVHVNLGMYVTPSDVMFKIVDSHHLHAELQVFEKDIMQLKIGQSIRIRLINENKDRMAKVYLIGKEISPERTVRVHGHLNDEDINLLPGLYFSAVIQTGSRVLLTLPENAFVNFEGKDYVFSSVGNSKFQLVGVVKGECENGFCVVSFDSAVPETIVIEGSYGLISLLKNKEEE